MATGGLARMWLWRLGDVAQRIAPELRVLIGHGFVGMAASTDASVRCTVNAFLDLAEALMVRGAVQWVSSRPPIR
jgi:hypothetical protein